MKEQNVSGFKLTLKLYKKRPNEPTVGVWNSFDVAEIHGSWTCGYCEVCILY